MAKASLAALAKQVRSAESVEPAKPDSAGRAASPGPSKRGPRPPERKGEPLAREGKKGVTTFYPEEVHEVLRTLRYKEKTTNQALFGEALDLLFRSRGLHPSASANPSRFMRVYRVSMQFLETSNRLTHAWNGGCIP